jgi:hypothetical protein
LIETVRQTRLSLNALFKQTEIAIARSERLIKQTDENVAKWRVWGSDEPEQTIGRWATKTKRGELFGFAFVGFYFFYNPRPSVRQIIAER